MIRSQSFGEPLPLDCELEQYFLVLLSFCFFSSPQDGTDDQRELHLDISLLPLERRELSKLGISIPPGQLSAVNNPEVQALVKYFLLKASLVKKEQNAWPYFIMVPFSHLLLEAQGDFSLIFIVGSCR